MTDRDAFIEDLRRSGDIVDIISQYTPLKRRGKNHLGLCPFHAEKTPSFTVSAEKQLFYCFGCREGGNLYTFLMKVEGISFPESVKWLADRLGKSLPQGFRVGDAKESAYTRWYTLYRAASELYRKYLTDSPGAEDARKFLNDRVVDSMIAEEFHVGAAPDAWDFLWSELQKKDFTKEEIVQAGLGIEREGGRYQDFFRGRVLFPIQDFQGRIVAFGGRTLGSDEPKYLNSAESPIFQKSSILYGFFQAKDAIRSKKKVVLVEGYMDVLACMAVGVRNVCAPLGTALTEEHGKRLARLVQEVILFLDSDGAGEEATWRAIEILRRHNMVIRVARAEGAKDPDELFRRIGGRAVVQTIQEAPSWFQFLLNRLTVRHNAREVEGRTQAVQEVVKWLVREEDLVRLEGYVELAANFFHIRGAVIQDSIAREKRKVERNRPADRRSNRPAPEEPKITRVERAARWLIRITLEAPEFLAPFQELPPELYPEGPLQEIALLIRKGESREEIIQNGNEEVGRELSRVLLDEEPIGDVQKTFKDCVGILQENSRGREKNSIHAQLVEAEKRNDRAEVEKLARSLQDMAAPPRNNSLVESEISPPGSR